MVTSFDIGGSFMRYAHPDAHGPVEEAGAGSNAAALLV
jgi:N-acetylglucosamine kinase